MSTGEKTTFLLYCKLTCFGGSGKGECACRAPTDCELRNHPKFFYFKKLAEERFRRFVQLRKKTGKDPLP